jgi:hypothetical protein
VLRRKVWQEPMEEVAWHKRKIRKQSLTMSLAGQRVWRPPPKGQEGPGGRQGPDHSMAQGVASNEHHGMCSNLADLLCRWR